MPIHTSLSDPSRIVSLGSRSHHNRGSASTVYPASDPSHFPVSSYADACSLRAPPFRSEYHVTSIVRPRRPREDVRVRRCGVGRLLVRREDRKSGHGPENEMEIYSSKGTDSQPRNISQSLINLKKI